MDLVLNKGDLIVLTDKQVYRVEKRKPIIRSYRLTNVSTGKSKEIPFGTSLVTIAKLVDLLDQFTE